MAPGRIFNLALPPLSLLFSLVAPVPGGSPGPLEVSILGYVPGLAGTIAAAAHGQECTIGFEHVSVGIGESVEFAVLFVESDPAGCGAGKKVPLKHEPFGGAESPEDYSLSRDTITLGDTDGTTSFGLRVVNDTIADEDDEGAYIFFGDLPSGVVAASDADTMTMYINDDDLSGPDPPSDLRAAPGDEQVTLSWMPPADTGKSAISRYRYRFAEDSDEYQSGWEEISGGAAARSVTETGLDNGTLYKFQVQALNSQGGSDPAEAKATPSVPSVLTIGDVTVAEGDGTASLEVTLTPESHEAVTVDYTTADGTATAGDDYTAADGTLTFQANETSQEITIAITGDTDDEDAENFTVTLSSDDNVIIDDGTGQVTITDDDELPGPPRDLAHDVDEGQVTLSWSPPASTGSAEIDGYEYRYAEGSNAFPDQWTGIAGGDAAGEVTIENLANGTSHRFQVRAVNEVGGGDPAETTATPAAPPSLSIGDVSVAEGGETAVLEVTLTPASAETVTVDFATADVTATADEDYTPTDGTLTFSAGVTSREVTVSITDDADDENAETLTVTLSDAVNAVIGDGTAEVTIEDDDLTPGPPRDLAADPDDGRVALSWSPPSISGSSAITGYQYRYAENSDAYPQTWTPISGGDGAREVTVGSLANGTPHRFQVRAVNDVGGGEPAEKTATPAIPPSLSIGDVSVAEDGETAILEVTLTLASVETVTVGYGTADATALAGDDYTTKDGTLTFPAGEISMQVSVSITDDTDDEDDETFTVTLSGAVNAVIDDGTGEVTIEDDDVPPGAPEDLAADPDNARVTLSWSPPSTVGSAEITGYEYRYAKDLDAFPDTWTGVSGGSGADEVTVRNLTNGTVHRFQVRAVNEVGGGEAAETTATPEVPPVLTISDVQVGEGDGTAVVEVTLTPVSVETVKVNYATANATATAGEDYTATNGTLTFDPGVTSRDFSVLITEDPADEDDETFAVTLSNPVNATIGDATGEVTIGDDDQAPGPPRDLSAEAGDSMVRLSWSPPADSGTAAVTEYQYRYAAGSAAYPETWTDISDGAAAREITVGDLTNNVVHRFQVRAVSNAGGGEPAQTSATPRPPPSLTIGDVTIDESDGPASVQVTLSRTSDSTVTVKYQTADGTATAGQDYTSVTGTLTFTPGMTSLDIDVAIADDDVEEATETLTANLSDARNAVIRDATGQLQILDNDERPGPPQGLVADPDDGRVKLSWTPPANSGSTPVTEYEYRYVAGPNAYPNTWVDVPGGAGAREVTIRGLTNGIQYRFEVRAVNSTGGGEPAEVTATPATAPSLAISDGSADERDRYAELTVTLGPPSTEVVTVGYTTVSGSATAGDDFEATDGTVTFAAGVTRQRIRIPIIADRIEERTESFTVVLRNATNADLADSIGQVLIDDDDEPPGRPRGLVAEPGDGEVTLRWFPPTDSGSTPITRYEYRYAPDSEEYSGSWTVAPGGAGARQVVVGNLTNGTRYRFQVRAVNRVGGGPPAEVAAVPETTHLLTINDVEVGEGDATAVLHVTLTPASDQSVTVAFATANGTATMGEDYVAAAGTLTFPPNVTSQGISLDIVDDPADESNETFFVTLGNATNAVISDVTGQVTILDNDDPAVDPPGRPLQLEAEPGDGQVTLRWFPPTNSGSTPITRYEYRYAPDSEEYSGSWTVAPGGAGARQVVVGNLTNGTRYRFQVRAVNRVGGGPPAEVAAVPETTHLLTINDVEVGEGDATAVLEVTLTPASDQSVTVAFATANGTATMGEDYVAAAGTLTFPPNVTSQGISLDIVDDPADESNETFFVTLGNATNAVISDVTGQVTILDNDDPAGDPPGRPLQLEAEPGDGQVTLSWSPPASDGGAAITGYEYRFAAESAAFTDLWARVPGGSGARDIAVEELSNGTLYRFQVRALNSAGPGPVAEAEATPRAGGAVSVSPQRLEVQEGDSAEYSIVLLEEPLGSVTVRMTADLSGTGLGVHPSQLLFTQSNWDVARTITVRAAVDPDEDDESGIALTHEASGGGYDTVAVPTVLVDVRDSGLPVLSGEGGRATEGQGAQLLFNVRLSAASTEPVTVEFATADETAVAGEDFQERSGQLVFSPGTTHLTVPVPLVNDQRHEQLEAFRLELFNPVNAKFPVVLERLVVTGTIVDDDELIRVSFDAGAYEVNEGGEVEVAVELSRDPGRTVEVPISVSRGRGAEATEFSVPRTVSFDPGQTRSAAMFSANEDEVDEVDETVVLRLGPLFPEELVAGNPTVAEVKIIDDDERGLQVSTEVLELQEGGSVDYSVWLASEPTGNVTVAVGGDLAGSDVAVSPTVLAFTPLNWNERQTVTVGASEDGDAVEDQDVVLRHRGSGADYTGVETRTVVVTVIEDDTPVLVVADARASEEEGQLIFEATLDIQSSREVAAEYITVNGTATEGMDFLRRQGVLVFAPLETSTRLIVPLVDDEVDEATEYFTLQVGSIVNAEPAGGSVSATGAILDDDVPTVRITADVGSVPEGGEARFRLVREGDLSVSMNVPVAVTETGEFLAGTPPDSVEFTVGEAEAILVLATVDDELDERDGTIEATITTSDDYEIGGSATASLTVTDNDAVPAIIIAGAQASEREGEIVFPVTLRGASAYEVTVNWVTADGTARAGADYTAGADKVLFAPGETSGSVRVAVLDDLLPEPAETFTVSLSGATNARIEVASATGTITDDDEAMIKGWLSRFGRTVASQVVEGISGRLTGGGGGAHLNTAGAAADPGDGRGPALRDLMDGSGFRLSRRSGGQMGDALSGGVWTAWGQGVRTAFEGAEVGLTVDGSVLTGMAGVDYEVGRYLAGVAVARSQGGGTLTMPASETVRERTEDVESGLTGVYPYLRVNVTDRVFAWGLLGHGRGNMTFPSVGRPSETDIRLNMGAFGARGVLLDPGSSRIGLALKSDVFLVGMSTEAHLGGIEVMADANRVRLLLEASERREVGPGEILVSTAEMGLRHDGGDADVGTGLEVGAGSRYVHEAYGLSAEGTIRWLMVHHAAGFSEWGVGASVLYEPGGAERGLSVRLGSSWGMAVGSAADLWFPGAGATMAAGGGRGGGADDGTAKAFTAQVRYGLSPSGRRWSIMPYAEIGLAPEARAPTSRVGWRVTLMESLRLSLETGLGGAWDDTGRAITLRGSLLR